MTRTPSGDARRVGVVWIMGRAALPVQGRQGILWPMLSSLVFR